MVAECAGGDVRGGRPVRAISSQLVPVMLGVVGGRRWSGLGLNLHKSSDCAGAEADGDGFAEAHLREGWVRRFRVGVGNCAG